MRADSSTVRRDDLQGLRAVAVLAVIAYHIHLPGFSGGFVGVDIFFVLSGFFITRVLMRDIETFGRVRWLQFWGSRAKRLLPNALLTLFAVIIAAAAFMPSYRFTAIASDVTAAATFWANFHFATIAVDYFHLGDPPSPVLHYWSLSVEEQFYIGLPVLMSGVALLFPSRRRLAVISLLILVASLSFFASLFALDKSQPVAFFHPEYRAWQLAIGGLVGILLEKRCRLPASMLTVFAWGGMLAIVMSVTLLSDEMIYPGLWALLPTLGTAAFVTGLGDDRSTRPIVSAMSLRPMVKTGDLSYSLYLWHWPIIVFAGALWPENRMAIAGAVLVTFLVAALAYRWVEMPVHSMKISEGSFGRIYSTALASIVIVCISSMALSAIPGKTPPAIAAAIKSAVADLGANYQDGCHLDYDVVDQPPCHFGSVTPTAKRVVLFGDSHAAQWFTPLSIAATKLGWSLVVRTKSSCPPFDVTVWYIPLKSSYRECDAWRAARMAEFKANPPDLIIITASNYAGWLFDRDTERPARKSANATIWRDGANRTMADLESEGIRVVRVRDTPVMYKNYLDCLSGSDWNQCGRPRRDALAGMLFATSPKIEIVDFSDAFCDAAVCQAADRSIRYRDKSHLTATYAATFEPQFERILEEPVRHQIK